MIDMTLWWGSIRRATLWAHLSAWQLLASAPILYKCIQFQTRLRSYLHSHPLGECLRGYHALFIVSIKIGFKKKTTSGFLPLCWCGFHCHASVDLYDWEHRKYQPCTLKWEWTAWQCWYYRKSRGNFTRMAKTPFNTFPGITTEH